MGVALLARAEAEPNKTNLMVEALVMGDDHEVLTRDVRMWTDDEARGSAFNRLARLAVSIGHEDHLLGSRSPAATIVWYGDYECPHCRHTWLAMKSITVARTAVRVAFRHFPTRFNGDEITPANAAEAAGAQGRFWEMHDLLFANPERIAEKDLTHLALRAGVEIYRFAADFASERHAPKIRRDLDSGVRSGVVRTPTFFLDGMIVSEDLALEALGARVIGPQPPAQNASCNGILHRLDQW